MEPVLISVYTDMARRLHCTSDDILHDPSYRNEFLSLCRRSLGSDRAEPELLKGLSNLRKRSKLRTPSPEVPPCPHSMLLP